MTSFRNRTKNMFANNLFQSVCEIVMNVSTLIFIRFYTLLKFGGTELHYLIFSLENRSLASTQFFTDSAVTGISSANHKPGLEGYRRRKSTRYFSSLTMSLWTALAVALTPTMWLLPRDSSTHQASPTFGL